MTRYIKVEYYYYVQYLKGLFELDLAEGEEQLPGSFLCLELLVDLLQLLKEIEAKARQHLLLGDVDGLGMAFTTSTEFEDTERDKTFTEMVETEKYCIDGYVK